MQLKEFLELENIPTFLSQSKVLLSFDKVDKIFPKIGLTNSSKECILNNSNFIKASAISFLSAIQYILDEAGRTIFDIQSHFFVNKNMTPEKQEEIQYFGNLILILRRYVNVENCITIDDSGKLLLKICDDIIDVTGKVIFKKNESLFKIYTNIYKSLLDLKCGVTIEKLESMPEFKRFSSDNLPQKAFKIVFSSDGVDGLWDISTMSMRGISSCQSWSGQYKNNLIGSIVDPFVGVIYITSGTNFNHLGTKMVKRCIVRFIIVNDKPCILIDKMYPEFDQEVLDKFTSFIEEKVDNKFKILYGPTVYTDCFASSSYIPLSPTHSKLTTGTLSYRDTKVPFKFEKSEATIFEKNLKVKKTKFINLLKNSAYESTSNLKNLKLKKGVKQDFISTVINSPDFKFLVKDFYIAIAEATINFVSNEQFLTSKDYMKKLCFFYLNNKELCTKNARTNFVKKINDYYKSDYNSKLSSIIVAKILSSVQKDVESEIKTELKKMITTKKKSKSKIFPNRNP